jgi:hypothetical protein
MAFDNCTELDRGRLVEVHQAEREKGQVYVFRAERTFSPSQIKSSTKVPTISRVTSEINFGGTVQDVKHRERTATGTPAYCAS